MYRPPNSRVDYYNHMIDSIEYASSFGCDMYILGDLNIDVKPDKCTSFNEIVKLENMFGLSQLVKINTRVTTTSRSLIDVILTTAPNITL